MTPQPILAVIVLSDSFSALWPDIATECDLRLITVPTDGEMPAHTVATVIAAGGREEDALDVLAARLLDCERGDLLVHREQLEDADPAAVAGLPAAGAAALAVEGHPVGGKGDVVRDPGLQQLVHRGLVHLAAVRRADRSAHR